MHRVIERGEKTDDQNVKNPWNWSWCEKVKAFSIKEKLPSSTWNGEDTIWTGEDTITLMVGSTTRNVFRLHVMA